ncbi:MAG: hypothetical protein ACFB15_25790 [Cyclobacteriaceae bacterium]
MSERPLTPLQVSYKRGLHYLREKQSKGGNDKTQSTTQGPDPTARRLGKHYGVSTRTIYRDSVFAQGLEVIGRINTKLKIDIITGEKKVTKAKIAWIAENEKKVNADNLQDLLSQSAKRLELV